jgi:pimeloyl-ACP methyl ester carboxylesterase
VEKFQAWTDSVELPEEAVDRDRLLTNVMLYWLTGTAGSAARIYYERTHATGDRASRIREPSTVPTAVAVFPAEIQIPLRRKGELIENVVRWTELGRGGHFAAMEEPDLLVEDIRAFFRQLREKD